MEGSLSSLHLAECVDLRDRGHWWWVPARHSRHISVATTPSQVPWHSTHKALQVELRSDKGEGSSRLEVLLNLSLPIPFIKTASIKEKKKENNRKSYCHRTHSSGGKRRSNSYWTNLLLQEFCSLPGVHVKEMMRKLPILVCPSPCYPLFIFSCRQ